jgi:electron transport protein HydN
VPVSEAAKELKMEKDEFPRSGYIKWNPDECTVCSRCVMACSVYHDGSVSYQLSPIKWLEENTLHGFRFRKPLFCQQCNHPECYYACPLKDKAMCIDSQTGTRYVNREQCIGCGRCLKACPFEEPRISIDKKKKVAVKCDLCMNRPSGPVCVQICDRQALTLISKEERF